MPPLKPFPKVRPTLNLEEFDFIQRAARSVASDTEDPDHEIACQVSAKLDACADRTNRAKKSKHVREQEARDNRGAHSFVKLALRCISQS